MSLAVDGGVFRRQAEGVPADGMENVAAAHALEARDGVAHGVVAHVAHVQVAGGIGEHLQQVVLGAGVVGAELEELALVPEALPLGLDGFVVVVGHGAELLISYFRAWASRRTVWRLRRSSPFFSIGVSRMKRGAGVVGA